MLRPTLAARRRLAPLVVCVAASATIATSAAHWRVTRRANGAPFELTAAPGNVTARRIQVRANDVLIGASDALRNGISLAVTVRARGAIAGTPRPADLRLTFAPETGVARTDTAGGFATASIRCERGQPCDQVFALTVEWHNAPPGQRAEVTWSVEASAEVRGPDRPPSAAVEIRVLDAPLHQPLPLPLTRPLSVAPAARPPDPAPALIPSPALASVPVSVSASVSAAHATGAIITTE